jgi:hypothetical protein
VGVLRLVLADAHIKTAGVFLCGPLYAACSLVYLSSCNISNNCVGIYYVNIVSTTHSFMELSPS